MRKILGIAWNDIKIEFSERSTLVFFLILPLVFTLIIGQGLQGMYDDDEESTDPRYPVLIVDEDQSELSAMLLQFVEASDVIRPVASSRHEADDLLAQEQALAGLYIPSGFGEGLQTNQNAAINFHTAQEDNRVMVIERAVSAAVGQVDSAVQIARVSVKTAENIRPFDNPLDRESYFYSSLTEASLLLADPPVRVETTQSSISTAEISTGFDQSSPGQLVTWTLVTLLGASEVFVNERLDGTLRRLLVTPTRKSVILLGKISGRLALGLFQMVVLIGFGALVLKVNWGRSPAALMLIVLAFALAAVALGVLLAVFARTRSQASGLTTMFAMLMAALGGAWWPLEVTPPLYQTIVKALPTTWAMIGFNDVIIRGLGVQDVLLEVAVLLAFAGLFFIVGIRRMQFE
jgi:ABC-2 type transport system permease protein